jgi:hypothetical protein
MPATFRAKIRMYRHGLGDCLLVTLPRQQGPDYFILIDCGVILGTRGASALMTRVMDDIRKTTDGRVNLLVATHEHWDHLSGFVQAPDSFTQLEVDEVWMGWTEDPADPVAKRLSAERADGVKSLRMSASRLEMAGAAVQAQNISGLLDFFGAARGPSTRDALEAVRQKSGKVRYCRPCDPPTDIPNTGARIFVLGPPLDEKWLRKTRPSAKHPQTYQLVADAFVTHAMPALRDEVTQSPFGPMFAIPWVVAQETESFRDRYFKDGSWRRIDSAWLDGATGLGLALDNATNNTSLVLAIELPAEGGAERAVLLFAADAQVGSWLSWQDLEWSVDGGTVKGPDLLRRTVAYKVGHHGSHNATLKEQGLELMAGLEWALLPVNEEMAKKKNWGKMPLPALLEALVERARGKLVRADGQVDGAVAGVLSGDLWVEVTL